MWILIFVWACETFVRQGEALLDLFYVREKFGFADTSEAQEWWRIFFFVHSIWGMIVLMVFVPILKRLYSISDPCIIVFSAFGSFFRSLIFIVARNKQNLYIGSIVDMLNLAGSIAARSGVLAVVDDPTEVGKALGVIAVVHELVRIATPYYWEIALATRDWHFAFVYCLNCTIFVLVMIAGAYAWIYFRRNKVHEKELARYGELKESSAEREMATGRKKTKTTPIMMNTVL